MSFVTSISPQYILLNANLPLMNATAAPLINVLTNDTWGIHISAQDTAHGQLSAGPAPITKLTTVGGKSGPSAGGKGKATTTAKAGTGASKDTAIASITHTKEALSTGLYTNIVQPHKTLDCLKVLCDIISPPELSTGSNKGNKNNKSINSKKSKGPVEPAGIIRTSQITTIAVLGFTHAHMCLESINILSKLLSHVAPSLTDLNLSFAYTGQNGAICLKDALLSSSCQLIRLAIAGNNLSDNGIEMLSHGLKSNKTLTYLDIRSNQITSSGLRRLCSALTATNQPSFKVTGTDTVASSSSFAVLSSTTSSLYGYSGNMTLSLIDLSGNILSQADILNSEKSLRDWGVGTTLKFIPQYPGYYTHAVNGNGNGNSNGNTSIDIYKTSMSIPHPIGTYELYIQPNKIISKMACDMLCPGAILYTIDLRYVNTHYAYHTEHPIVIEWNMRPSSETTTTSKDTNNGTGGPSNPCESPWLLEPTKLRWELRLETPVSDIVIMRGQVSASACIFNQQGEESTWAQCRAIAYNVPSKGHFIITVYTVEGTHVPTKIESCNLTMYSIPPMEYNAVGGDFSGWDHSFNGILSVSPTIRERWVDWTAEHGTGLIGFTPMRALHWNLPSTATVTATSSCAKISWSSRLIPIGGSGSGSGSGAQDATMGYSWIIILVSGGISSGKSQIVSQGTCFSSSTDITDTTDAIDGSSALHTVLQAWSWKTFHIVIPKEYILCTGDILIVAAKPLNPNENSITAKTGSGSEGGEGGSCTVDMKSCTLWCAAPASHDTEPMDCTDIRTDTDIDNTVNNTHNRVLKVAVPVLGLNGEYQDRSVDCGLGVFALHNTYLDL